MGDFPQNTLGKGEKFKIININIVLGFSDMMSIADLFMFGLSEREDIHTALPQFGWNVLPCMDYGLINTYSVLYEYIQMRLTSYIFHPSHPRGGHPPHSNLVRGKLT